MLLLKVGDRIREIFKENVSDVQKIRNEVTENTIERYNKCKINYDKRHCVAEMTVYKDGDYVMTENTDNTIEINKKILPKYKGLYVLKNILPNDRYVLEDPPDFQIMYSNDIQ